MSSCVAKHTIKIVQVLHYTSNGMSFFKLQSTWFLAPKFPFLMTPKTFILVFTNDSNTTKNLFFTKRVLKNVCTILLSSYLCRLLPKPKRILACKCHTKYVWSFEQICLHLSFAASNPKMCDLWKNEGNHILPKCASGSLFCN